MIKQLNIKGWKSFKALNFRPRSLNVLIGPNQSGKSNLVDFFLFLQEVLGEDRLQNAVIRRGGFREILWAKKPGELRFHLEFTHKKKTFNYNLNISIQELSHFQVEEEELKEKDSGRWNTLLQHNKLDSSKTRVKLKKNEELVSFEMPARQELGIHKWKDPVHMKWREEFVDFFKNFSCHLGFNTLPGSPMREPLVIQSGTTETPPTRLAPQGDNLGNVLYHLSNHSQYATRYEEMLDILKAAFPLFEKLTFPVDAGKGRILLGWKEKGFNEEFSSTHLSDGTLKFLCLLAILLDPNPPSVIFIDEPEASLHPRLLMIVADLLKAVSKRTQIFAATHSPRLISYLAPDDVVIVEKDEQGASTLKRLKPKELENWLKDFTLGELWEMGELGG